MQIAAATTTTIMQAALHVRLQKSLLAACYAGVDDELQPCLGLGGQEGEVTWCCRASSVKEFPSSNTFLPSSRSACNNMATSHHFPVTSQTGWSLKRLQQHCYQATSQAEVQLITLLMQSAAEQPAPAITIMPVGSIS